MAENITGASASSITTRIKTDKAVSTPTLSPTVRVHLPLQQGLRLAIHLFIKGDEEKCECIFHYNKD